MIYLRIALISTLVHAVQAQPTTPRVIQYDEGIFGKINLHDLRNSAITTYSPVAYVKKPNYFSSHTDEIIVDKGQKHFFKEDGDWADSRYVYNFIARDQGLLDGPDGAHMARVEEHLRNRIAKGGIEEDPLYKRIALARRYGKEILLNYRANDVHWGGPTPARPELQSKFWLAHPQYYVNPTGKQWKDGALNYAEPEVREYQLQFYEEGLNLFDNDGVLIDMMRNPTFFPPGKGWKNREHLTGFLREVRKLVDTSKFAAGKSKMTIGLRVPPTVEYCEKVGMDVRKWAKEGLVDFMAVSTFMKQDPNLQVATFRKELGVDSQSAVYACFQRRNYGFGSSASFGQYRGMAANMWGNEKAEGLLLFNWMQQEKRNYLEWRTGKSLIGPHPDLANELASLNTLAGRNKVYSVAWGSGDQYPDMPYFNPLPKAVKRGATGVVKLGVHEQIATHTPERIILALQLMSEQHVDVSVNDVACEVIPSKQVKLPMGRINGRGLKSKARGVNNDWVERKTLFLSVPARALIDGMNEIQVTVPFDSTKEEITIFRTDLFVQHGSETTHGSF